MSDDVLHPGDRTGQNEESDDDMEGVECRACGTQFFGVDETECKRWEAAHVLEEHEDEAPDPILEQARERLEEFQETTA